MSNIFQVIAKDSSGETHARIGLLQLNDHIIETPIFMPVGTYGTVKTLSHEDLYQIPAPIILHNTYHLTLRPGLKIIEEAGGIRKITRWKGALLTDSGGFQVFSLATKRKIDDSGIIFQSHIDGTKYHFTPESTVDAQRIIQPDIMMPLDFLTPANADYEVAKRAMQITYKWYNQSIFHAEKHEQSPILFPILQGNIYPDLRKIHIELTLSDSTDDKGYAIGGLSVGEDRAIMYDIIAATTELLPEDKPRYLMGVGEPIDLLNAIEQGIDMFDCVFPTRMARNGWVFTNQGRLKLRKSALAKQDKPIESNCMCYTCKNFSRAYLHLMAKVDEILALRLATIHNLTFIYRLFKEASIAIKTGNYKYWKNRWIQSFRADNATCI